MSPEQKVVLKRSRYEPLLKEELSSFKTDDSFKTIPKLKEHLKAIWFRTTSRGVKTLEKRKREAEEDEKDDRSKGKRARTVEADE